MGNIVYLVYVRAFLGTFPSVYKAYRWKQQFLVLFTFLKRWKFVCYEKIIVDLIL